MNHYRVAIIGLSWITSEPSPPGTHDVLGLAPPHSHLSALATMPNVQVVCGCDIVPESGEKFVQTWGGTWPELQVYTDYQEMFSKHQVDVVCVATPDHLHAPFVLAAIANGARGVFCEKPLAVSLEDADAMIAAAEASNVTINVNNTRRFMPAYVAAHQAVADGSIGPLANVSVNFGGERAMMFRNHAHFLDLICWFAGGEPGWVFAELEPGYETYGTSYKGDGGRTPELEPGLNAYIGFDNGVRGFLSGWKSSTQQVSLNLYGRDGQINVNEQQATLVQKTDHGLATTVLVPRGRLQGFQAGLADLIRALDSDHHTVQSPPREARKTVALFEAILQSHAAGGVKTRVDHP